MRAWNQPSRRVSEICDRFSLTRACRSRLRRRSAFSDGLRMVGMYGAPATASGDEENCRWCKQNGDAVLVYERSRRKIEGSVICSLSRESISSFSRMPATPLPTNRSADPLLRRQDRRGLKGEIFAPPPPETRRRARPALARRTPASNSSLAGDLCSALRRESVRPSPSTFLASEACGLSGWGALRSSHRPRCSPRGVQVARALT